MKKTILILTALLAVLLPAVISCNSTQIVEGELVLVAGYLRVEDTLMENNYLLLWPDGYSWHMDDRNDRRVMIDDTDGRTVAGVGDNITVSGSETDAAVARKYMGETPDAVAKGPYWLVEEVVARSPKVYISRDEAVNIVSEIVPSEVAARAGMMARLTPELGQNGMWQVQFLRANATRTELGWQEDDKTEFEPDTGKFLAGSTEWEGVYPNLIITIDAVTGEIVSRSATTSILLGGPIHERPLYPEFVPKEE